MNRDYWDSMAERYEDNLLEIATEEGAEVLEEELQRLADPAHRVADLGCGPGSLLPFLAERFGEVVAVDYSEKLLRIARRRCADHERVVFRCHDLGGREPLGLEAEVVCCLNALIDPRRKKRERMGAVLAEVTKVGGASVVVVPAFESVFHVYHTLIRCRRRGGKAAGPGLKEAERLLRAEVESFAGGIVRVGGVPTKYWMREELLAFLADRGLTARRVRRVEYAWREEIEDGPDWLGSPRPWDWLVVADRSGAADGRGG